MRFSSPLKDFSHFVICNKLTKRDCIKCCIENISDDLIEETHHQILKFLQLGARVLKPLMLKCDPCLIETPHPHFVWKLISRARVVNPLPIIHENFTLFCTDMFRNKPEQVVGCIVK